MNTYDWNRRRHIGGSDNCWFRHNDRSHRHSTRQSCGTHYPDRQMIRPIGRWLRRSVCVFCFRQDFPRRCTRSTIRGFRQSAAVWSGEGAATRRTGGFEGWFVGHVVDGDPRLDVDVSGLLGDGYSLLRVRSIGVSRRSSANLQLLLLLDYPLSKEIRVGAPNHRNVSMSNAACEALERRSAQDDSISGNSLNPGGLTF